MEKVQETQATQQTSVDSAGGSAPAPTLQKPVQKKRTFGNIVYDFGVFGSIAWIGVAALSAFSAHEAMHGNSKMFGWLRSLNDKVFSGLSNLISKTFKNASKETVDGYAKGTTMFLTLGMGGNALMAPIKWLEDNRQKNAARIDDIAGTIPPDPETIAHEPKQTWKSVLTGRLASWGLSYAAFLAMGPKLTGKISDYFGEMAAERWMKIRPQSNPASVRKWTDIAAFDVLFTIITAGLTYAFSRSFAKKEEKQHDFEDGIYDIVPTDPTFVRDAFADREQKREEKSYSESLQSAKKPAPKPQESYRHKIESEPELSHSLS
jgi:hypothetical protein